MSTLKKIANIAGCSMSTVSRALNNCHDVSAKTREECEQKLSELIVQMKAEIAKLKKK